VNHVSETIGISIAAIAMVAIFLHIIREEARFRKNAAVARVAYLHSLESLEHDPGNPELKQNALRLGRKFSDLTCDENGFPDFDEQMLNEEVEAVCRVRESRLSLYPVLAQGDYRGFSDVASFSMKRA